MSNFKVTSITMENCSSEDKIAIMEIKNEILESRYDALSYSYDENNVTDIINNFMDYQRSQGVYIYDMEIEFVWDD